jgi:hypothetical protein
MGLIELVVILVIVGVLLWLVETQIPMDQDGDSRGGDSGRGALVAPHVRRRRAAAADSALSAAR